MSRRPYLAMSPFGPTPPESIAATVEALDAVAAAAPNARDYYPQDMGAFDDAQVEHTSRIKRLDSVREELQAIAEHVARGAR